VNGPSSPADVDALFKLPLGEFTAARNALVAQLKRNGRTAEASKAKALAKPSVSAWVVNQLYWRHRALFDRLIDAGDRLRRAHAAQRPGDSARDAIDTRRETVAELADIATDLLREAGHRDTRDLLRRVTATLEALSSYGLLAGAPAAGRLAGDLESRGFEALLGVLPGSKKVANGVRLQKRLPGAEPPAKPSGRAHQRGAGERHAVQERKRRLAATKAAARQAEQTLNVARKRAERAAGKRETAVARARAIEAERAQIEKRLARISKEAEEAHEAAREAAAGAERAAQAALRAERALELARGRAKAIGT
jgi:hypothetical protein